MFFIIILRTAHSLLITIHHDDDGMAWCNWNAHVRNVSKRERERKNQNRSIIKGEWYYCYYYYHHFFRNGFWLYSLSMLEQQRKLISFYSSLFFFGSYVYNFQSSRKWTLIKIHLGMSEYTINLSARPARFAC